MMEPSESIAKSKVGPLIEQHRQFSRRSARRLLACLLLVSAACTTDRRPADSGSESSRSKPDTPNVLIVMTDDQRAGTMGVMPITRRWFASGGTTFRNAYATTPLCCPSRASVLTGRYSHNHGIVSNVFIGNFDHKTTLQRLLGEAGYRTAIVGKFLNTWPLEQRPPYFDLFSIFSPSVETRGYYGIEFNDNGRVESIDEYSTSYIFDRAKDFLGIFEEQDATPWFLVVAPFAPHAPFEAPAEYTTRQVPNWKNRPREVDMSDKPAAILENLTSRDADRAGLVRTAQLRTLMALDDSFGELISRLEDLDEDRDTLAFFLSDNGFLWGEHNAIGKSLPYQPSVRIPLMVRWPSVTHPATDGGIAATIDIAPTILDAVDIAPESITSMDGRSLLSDGERSRLLLEYHGAPKISLPQWRSVVTSSGRQYTEYYDTTIQVIGREFYDLTTDPEQDRNLLSTGENQPSGRRLSFYHRWLEAVGNCAGTTCR